jgi:hypothetical protein
MRRRHELKGKDEQAHTFCSTTDRSGDDDRTDDGTGPEFPKGERNSKQHGKPGQRAGTVAGIPRWRGVGDDRYGGEAGVGSAEVVPVLASSGEEGCGTRGVSGWVFGWIPGAGEKGRAARGLGFWVVAVEEKGPDGALLLWWGCGQAAMR